MAAVHAVSPPREAFQPRHHRSVVAFGGRSAAPRQRRFDLRAALAADHDGRHGGARERILDALHGRQCAAEGRVRHAEQVAAAVDLHHVDAHARALAQFVEPFAFGIDVVQRAGIAFVGPQRVDVLACGLQVVGRIDREHQYVDEPRFDGHARHGGVVAAQTDRADASLGFEPLGEPDDRPVEDRAQVGLGVDVVDHPHVEIVGAQLPQLSFELPAPSFERRTDVGAQVGV